MINTSPIYSPHVAPSAQLASLLSAVALLVCHCTAVAESLDAGFERPPLSAAPRVWWQWMDGNVSKDGIKLDLEWMHRVGLGGLQNFDASIGTPELVDPPLAFMTSGWKEAFRSAVELADRMGLEFGIASAPGWSESGGPWVKPFDGMKKLVWTEARVQGGSAFEGKLPHPPSVTGPFQNAPVQTAQPSGETPKRESSPELYKDVAVLAYRLPEREVSSDDLHPDISTRLGRLDARSLQHGDFTRGVVVPAGDENNPAWLQIDWRHSQKIESMTLGLQQPFYSAWGPRHMAAVLQSSNDGVKFQPVATAYDSDDYSFTATPPLQETVTFPSVSARYFRLVLHSRPPSQMSPALVALLGSSVPEHRVTQWTLHSSPKVNHFEQKAGFFLGGGIESYPTPHIEPSEAIRLADIVDLTDRMRPDGTLSWTPPAGRWAILRIGYSLLGITNHPASAAGQGIEVDKLRASAVKGYIESYLRLYQSFLADKRLIGTAGVRAMISDSYEAGAQNWTDELPSEFSRRRGYDLRTWMPALTGRIIQSAEATDRFLWDFRRTLSELIVDNHYGQIAKSLHALGMTYYCEAHELGRAFIGDGMDVKRMGDIPMGAMWVPGFLIPQEQYDADIRESASVAHLYGKSVVAAESMTVLGMPGSAYAFSPETLKPTADREFADGVNLIVVHTSVHQPFADRIPGMSLGPYGQWFTRHETWAEQATPWVDYLARSSYLLQQGTFAADILYYYGQDTNITALYSRHLPSVPDGYAFDFANSHALTQLAVSNGYLVTTSGMRYRLLVLDSRARLISGDALRAIAHLVERGATVVGEKPDASPSLQDNVVAYRALTNKLWGNGAAGEHRYGAGLVLAGMPLTDAVKHLNLEPDVTYSKPLADTTVWFVHRRLGNGGHLYFMDNRNDRSESIEAHFRVRGFAPELWHADTGLIEPASYRQEGENTVVPLRLAPYDAVFVVFRTPSQTLARVIDEPSIGTLGTISGPWTVEFQPGRGASAIARFEVLAPLNANPDAGIRYFSGTAVYKNTLQVPASWVPDRNWRLAINLGRVKNVAEVIVNGRPVGVLWKPPFRVDIGHLIHAGINQLEVRVTNTWVNRLIGDQQADATKVAFSTFNPYRTDSPLPDSGLLGPVTIERVTDFAGRPN